MTESDAPVGVAGQNYLKAIYELGPDGVAPSVLAEQLGVSPAAVTKMVKRLAELDLVCYERHQELRLSPAGEKLALEVIRHHRLLEVYLKELLGYSWDEVHAEAEKLEHVISEQFERRIDAALGHPTHDPHGDPIPTEDGRIAPISSHRLSELDIGEKAVIARVSDDDSELLRYLAQRGLFPNTPVEMREKASFGGSLTVRAGGSDHDVGREAAAQVFVRSTRPTATEEPHGNDQRSRDAGSK